MSITFGSVGDIIAVCILVKDCVHALSDTNGSAAEYQAVVRELYVLEKSLLEVGILSKTHATTPELTALFGNLETTINQCRASLVAFKAKTQRYEGHLGDTSTKGTARKLVSSSAKKILWQVQMRDDVSRFRAEVVAYSMSIDQLLAAATMHTMKAHNNTLITLFDKQDSSVKHLQTRLDEVNRRVTAGNNLLSALVRSTRANWLLQLGHDLKALMLKIVAVNLVTYAAVDKIQASVLDIQLVLPTLTRPISDPRIFYLEDAIGRVSTITLDFITSWDALLAVLEVRFQGKLGIKKVLKKEYVLQNHATGKDVNAKQKWETVFRPGLWFDMDMIFQKSDGGDSEGSLGTKCIRCHAQSEQPRGLGSTCLHCKHVLRIVDITDEASATTFAPEAPDSLVTAPPVKSERRIVHPVPPSGSGKRKRDDDPDEEPANFNRVRLIKPKKRRLNKDLPEQASSTEKRKQEDLMEIDVPNGSSKRHKYEDSQVDRCEQGHSAKTYLQKQQQQSEMKAWTSSQPMTDFNRSSGRENPSSFTTYRDGNEGPSSRSSPPKRSPSNLPKSDVARKRSVATEEDAIRAGIPSGYSYRNWDPEEEPIMLLGSVFDANSLGKWIYDWTVFFYGPTTPLAEMAGEFWLLLIQLAGKTKRAEDIIAKILKKESQEIVEDFLVSAERIWVRFTKLLKICEDYMWKAAKEEAGNKKPVSVGKNSGREFVESLFGKDRELEKTEELMMRMRLWSMRFDCNCEDILRYPRA